MVQPAVIVSTIATIVSVCMLSAPAKTVIGMKRNGTIGAMTITYFCCQLANCVSWAMYGVLQSAAPLMACNALGTAIATYCILVFMAVARREERSDRPLVSTTYHGIVITVLATMILACGLVGSVEVTLVLCGIHTASLLNGVLGACCSVVMLSSPLMMAGSIIRDRNAESLVPLTMSFALANSFLWLTYGVLMADPFIITPNLLGTLAVVFQFGLLLKYGRRTRGETVVVHEAVAHLPTLQTGQRCPPTATSSPAISASCC